MIELGPHATFIAASYGLTLIVSLIIVAWIRIDFARQTRLLAELEQRGVSRRSSSQRDAS